MNTSPQSEQPGEPSAVDADIAPKKEWVEPELLNISETSGLKEQPGQEMVGQGKSSSHNPS